MPKAPPPKVIPRSRAGQIRQQQLEYKGDSNERVELLRLDMKLHGFLIAKSIARALAQDSGEMDCPMCGQKLKFATASGNGHFRAVCSREGCIKAME